MAHVIENGLSVGLRTDEDFIRHFPPKEIMNGLADRPDLRANILVPTTGLRAAIASKKSAESAGYDLQIALDEGETEASVIVQLFHPDDRVRYLDKARLWDYITEPRFWERDSKNSDFDRSKAHLAFILDRAVEERIVNHREIVEGITVGKLCQYLPLTALQSTIEQALANGHNGKPFTEQDLLSAIPSSQLVKHVPLDLLWETVICPKVEEKNGLATTHATPAHTTSAGAAVSTTYTSDEGAYEGRGEPANGDDDSDLRAA